MLRLLYQGNGQSQRQAPDVREREGSGLLRMGGAELLVQ